MDATENPLALDRQVCFALAVASRRVISIYRPLLEPLGLTHPQYLVMLALWEDSPRSVKDIGSELGLEAATLSPLLKRLEAVGYLTRVRSRRDERQLEVTLTTTGKQLRNQALQIPDQVVDRLGLPMAELLELNDRLRRVIAVLSDSPA